ncbi:putative transmembrane protein [Toxoplasma gondii VAND]|uniref:Putative transmembrane protein n=1 Tax=Toxoplasma gondii VAND TaxID=933077 RepID=A0A086Q785_TOXGO|nr:putative transmembrane protein [Toxoplasma gondii VAND]
MRLLSSDHRSYSAGCFSFRARFLCLLFCFFFPDATSLCFVCPCFALYSVVSRERFLFFFSSSFVVASSWLSCLGFASPGFSFSTFTSAWLLSRLCRCHRLICRLVFFSPYLSAPLRLSGSCLSF